MKGRSPHGDEQQYRSLSGIGGNIKVLRRFVSIFRDYIKEMLIKVGELGYFIFSKRKDNCDRKTNYLWWPAYSLDRKKLI